MGKIGGDMCEKSHRAIPLVVIAVIASAFCLISVVLFQSKGVEMDIWQQAFFIDAVSLRTILTYHQFPFWNPWTSGGIPHLAYPFSSFLSPAFILSMFFGPETGLMLRILIVLWIGLWGGYKLGKRLAPGSFAPYLLASVFLLSSWYPLYMSQWHVEFMPFAYIPWLLLFLHKGFENLRFCACGAIVLALMVFEGGSYPVPYAMLFLFCYALLETIARREIRPLAAFFLVTILGLCMSGIKLLPMVEFLSRYRRATFWQEPVLPWAAVPRMLFGRDQLSQSDFVGSWLGWWEYGAYVGIVPFLAALAAPFLAPRKALPFILILLLSGALMFGDYGVLSPWHWLHKIPPFSSLHDASRFRMMLVFSIAILSAIAVSQMEMWLRKRGKRRWGSVLCGVAVTCIAVDLFMISTPVYGRFAKRSFPVPDGHQPFRQTRLAYEQRQGALPFVCFLDNKGLIDNVDGLSLPPADVQAYGDPAYKGEVWLERGEGDIELSLWSPNRLSYSVNVRNPDTAIINQRYEAGWRCTDDRPVHSKNGLIAIPVGQTDREVCIYYMPRYFIVGCVISAAAVICSCVLWRAGRRSRN